MKRLVGAILVGGASRRMGRPKHAVILNDGRTMLAHVATSLSEVCVEGVVVLGPRDEAYNDYPTIPDQRPDAGPLAGLEACLASGRAERYLVCTCDQPRVSPSFLVRMRDAEREALLLVPEVEDETQTHHFPMRIDAQLTPVVTRALDSGVRSVRALLATTPHAVVKIDSQRAARELRNVNTPGDLSSLESGSTEG